MPGSRSPSPSPHPRSATLDVSFYTTRDPRPRAMPLRRFLVPFARPGPPDDLTQHVPEIAGGNWAAGRALFNGKAVCATCHQLRGGEGVLRRSGTQQSLHAPRLRQRPQRHRRPQRHDQPRRCWLYRHAARRRRDRRHAPGRNSGRNCKSRNPAALSRKSEKSTLRQDRTHGRLPHAHRARQSADRG